MYDLAIFLDYPLKTSISTALAALGAYFAAYCLYQVYFSPLSSLPGPWHTAVTNLWINSHVIRMQKSVAIHQLFDRYGPVVRIGPGKVAFRDYAAMKDVYTTHKFDKSVYYETFLLNNDYHTFVLRDEAAHAIHRKKLAAHYTPSNTNAFQPEVYDLVYQLIDGMYGYAQHNTSIDCLAMIRHLMIDVLAESALGAQAASLSKWAAGEDDPLAVAVHDFPPLGVIRYLLPGWIWSVVCQIPVTRVQQFCNADKIVAKFVVARLEEVRSTLVEGKVDAAEKSLTVRLLAQENSSAGMTQTEIISEVTGHIIAAADTTSITVAFGLWVLSQRSDIMHKLRQEIDQAMPDSRTPPSINTLQDLPYLNAFIKETLRVYGALPSILEREVRAGKSTEQPFNLMGYDLPAGTVVGTQGWSVHRDPQVFPDPLAFKPERWLQTGDNADELVRMNQNFLAFGLGSRACMGKRLATTVARVTIASIVRNFNIVAPPETTQQSMTPKESFVIFPASMECKLQFVPRA